MFLYRPAEFLARGVIVSFGTACVTFCDQSVCKTSTQRAREVSVSVSTVSRAFFLLVVPGSPHMPAAAFELTVTEAPVSPATKAEALAAPSGKLMAESSADMSGWSSRRARDVLA